MAAQIIEERLDDEEDNTPQEDMGAHEPTPDDLPDKYRGKSAAELARMHQEAEKLLGRQSSEVGELRRVVDSYIQTELSRNQAPQQSTYDDDDDVDFFVDPDKAVARAIERHPKIREADALTKEYKKQTTLNTLQRKHPDIQEIVKDAKFAEWVQSSKIRTQLFIQADQGYDYDAADELFSLWKERQGVVQQTANLEKQARNQQARAASTGNARGNPEGNPRKIYRRADIIKLMKTDPDRYQAMSDEIMKAYAEGRVK